MEPVSGWVDLSLIANFHRMRNLTQDQSQIVRALKMSTKVELSEDETKLRTVESPGDWPLESNEPEVAPQLPPASSLGLNQNSGQLNVNVPEFVPGKPFIRGEFSSHPQLLCPQ